MTREKLMTKHWLCTLAIAICLPLGAANAREDTSLAACQEVDKQIVDFLITPDTKRCVANEDCVAHYVGALQATCGIAVLNKASQKNLRELEGRFSTKSCNREPYYQKRFKEAEKQMEGCEPQRAYKPVCTNSICVLYNLKNDVPAECLTQEKEILALLKPAANPCAQDADCMKYKNPYCKIEDVFISGMIISKHNETALAVALNRFSECYKLPYYKRYIHGCFMPAPNERVRPIDPVCIDSVCKGQWQK